MDSIFEKMKLVFDEKNNIIISKHEFLAIAKKVSRVNTFSEQEFLPTECYVLVDRNLKDFYPFPLEELDEWEKDGSCEKGNSLYRMQLLKSY